MNRLYRVVLGLVPTIPLLFIVACAGPATVADADRAVIRHIVVVAATQPSRIHFDNGGRRFPIATSMGEQSATQRKFDGLFALHTPDVAKALTDAAVNALRARGFTVEIGDKGKKADATLMLNLRAAGFGLSFDGQVLVPQTFLLVSLVRVNDNRPLYYEAFAYGGGFFGTMTKVLHDPTLAFDTAEDAFSKPDLMVARLVAGARDLGIRSVDQLRK